MKFLKDNLKTFLYWMDERHKVHLKKEAVAKWPWTKDKILQEYKFTNPFRNHDRVTRELISRLSKRDSKVLLLRKIVIFRMFNWPNTYDVLNDIGLVEDDWDTATAVEELTLFKHSGNKVFTGAYMMTGSGSSGEGGKIKTACQAIEKILHRQYDLVLCSSVQQMTEELSQFPMVGRFVGYEMATDMRHTKILNKAKDIYTWANPGPGAKRGVHRLLFNTPRGELPKGEKIDYQQAMQELMCTAQNKFVKNSTMPTIEMRDIEHSLCEFDKYMRVKNGEGRPRSKYKHKE